MVSWSLWLSDLLGALGQVNNDKYKSLIEFLFMVMGMWFDFVRLAP